MGPSVMGQVLLNPIKRTPLTANLVQTSGPVAILGLTQNFPQQVGPGLLNWGKSD